MLKSKFLNFLGNDRGSVAILFSLSLFVLCGIASLAVDFARAQSTKSALQQDLDSTLLFVGTEFIRNAGAGNPQSVGQTYFDGLRREKQIRAPATVSIEQPDNDSFRGTAKARVTTMLMGLVGLKELQVAVTSETQIGQQPVEFSLVLDNTGSMSGSKIEALKSASNSLIETIFNAPNAAANVKMSVVPFAEYVNVGLSNRNKPWMDVPLDTSETTNECSEVRESTEVPGSCREVTYSYTNDGVSGTGSRTQCDYTYGDPTTQCRDVTRSSTWRGCAGSRNYPLNVRDENYSVRIPGIMNVWCPNEITPLTNDIDVVQSAINNMGASGNTYIPAGLMWGWRTLSPKAPFEEGQDTQNGKRVRKIMVLMTDGSNTRSPTTPYDGAHYGNDTAKANTLTSELCTGIKTAGIEVYTVAFEVDDETVKDILEGCASKSGSYFDAGNEVALHDAFEKIAADFTPLRLTR